MDAGLPGAGDKPLASRSLRPRYIPSPPLPYALMPATADTPRHETKGAGRWKSSNVIGAGPARSSKAILWFRVTMPRRDCPLQTSPAVANELALPLGRLTRAYTWNWSKAAHFPHGYSITLATYADRKRLWQRGIASQSVRPHPVSACGDKTPQFCRFVGFSQHTIGKLAGRRWFVDRLHREFSRCYASKRKRPARMRGRPSTSMSQPVGMVSTWTLDRQVAPVSSG